MVVVSTGAVITGVGGVILNKLFGPTLEHYGNELAQHFSEKKKQTFDAISQNAVKKLGSKIEEEGVVPLRVLHAVTEEGTTSDDSVWVDYFGGVLASSRTPKGRDDRGARISKLISNMSVYQLRAHCIIYLAIHGKFAGSKNINVNHASQCEKLRINFKVTDFSNAMKFNTDENRNDIITHALNTLHQDGLIGAYGVGNPDILKKSYLEIVGDGHQMVVSPLLAGIELFLWAMGKGNHSNNYFLDTSFNPNFPSDETLKVTWLV